MSLPKHRMNLAPSSLARHLRGWIENLIATLDPACFAMVMATGIISNAMLVEGYHDWADLLFAVNLLAYPWLVLTGILRVCKYRRSVRADLFNPRMVFSFFAIVAATDVFGVSLYLRGFTALALYLWLFALLLWFVLIYFSFAVLIFLNDAQGADIIRGGWLIAIVATESLVILGALVRPEVGAFGQMLFVLLHLLWGIGLGLYGLFIVLFAHRVFFFDVKPDDITPLLWVIMGAAAISTNAGAVLSLTESGMPFLETIRPLVDGITLFMWAWGTWWIPLLCLFGIWKHGICRVPMTYSPMLWSLVFPLGMYALASLRFSLVTDFPPLHNISRVMVWVALAAWAATAAALILASWRSFSALARSNPHLARVSSAGSHGP